MRFTRAALLILFMVMLCSAAGYAQNEPAAATMPTASQMLAHRLTAMARQALTTPDQSQPTGAQIAKARILLDQANQLDGSDAERWLLTAEACALADDRDGRIDALKQYMRLAPDDDVAQLQFIDLLMDKMQTADQRMAYLLKIAEGSLASHFSAPLRSRVAYRAAMLAAAQGDPQTYGRLLSSALQLDSTNKAAAAESLRVLSASSDASARERAAAMLTLFHADPTDSRTHAAIGQMLLSMAQYGDAAGWFSQAVQIENANLHPAPIALLHEWALALWGDGRGADAVELLSQLDPPAPKGGADSSAPSGGADSSAPESSGQPKPAANPDWPPLDTLMLRAAILASSGTDAERDAAYQRLNDRFTAQLKKTPDAPATLAAQAWAQLLCDRNTDETAPILDKLEALPDTSQMQPNLMRGWLAMRTDTNDVARKLLEPLSQSDPRAALGLALTVAKQGDQQQATQLLQQVVRQSPADIFGLIAASHLRRMSQPLPQIADARQVASVFAAVPDALRHITADPLHFVQLRLNCDALRYDFGQPIVAQLEIRNVSSYPMSLEPGGSIPSRVLLMPNVTVDLLHRPQLAPRVLNLGRRLRLDPFRSMSVPIRLDGGGLGSLLTAMPWSRVQIDETAMLNPAVGAKGAFTPGLLGSVAMVRNLVRRNVAMTSQAINQRVIELGGSDPAASMRAMAMLIAALPQGDDAAPEQTQAADTIAKTMVEGWANYSPTQQAYLVSLVPDNQKVTDQLSKVMTEAARCREPLVQLAMVATQVKKPDDPVLNAALRNSDPTVRRFAEAQRIVLQAKKPAADEE